MTLDDIKTQVIEDLTTELQNDESFNSTLLSSKVNHALQEVRFMRRYPSTYTDEMIVEDMARFTFNIYNIALYDYNRAGVEETSSYAANGETRNYTDRNKLFYGVIPIGGVV